MATIYFEDLEVGTRYQSPDSVVVDEDEMMEYNRKNDPWPFHVDEEAARQSPYGGIIASGGYTLSLAYRLSHKVYNTPTAPWAFLGAFDWHLKFPIPVRAGDILTYSIEVLSKRLSSKPGRGVLNGKERLTNQNGEVVYEVEFVFLMATRPTQDAVSV